MSCFVKDQTMNKGQDAATLTEVFRAFTSVVRQMPGQYVLAKTGHGPHSSKIVVLFCVLFVCKCVLPPGDNPIAVNKYIISYDTISRRRVCQFFTWFRQSPMELKHHSVDHLPIELCFLISDPTVQGFAIAEFGLQRVRVVAGGSVGVLCIPTEQLQNYFLPHYSLFVINHSALVRLTYLQQLILRSGKTSKSQGVGQRCTNTGELVFLLSSFCMVSSNIVSIKI